MSSNKKPITKTEQVVCIVVGLSIAVFYTGMFILVFNSPSGSGFSLIPEADAQILPFEQQLEQIRNPQECTRKVVQGASAEVPFTIKLFYDTTGDVKLEFKQQGTSFPIRQTTNQVMTFYTEEPDQYEIYFEVNYDEPKERQVYIEYLSNNAITQSTQEKFEGTKFCMTLFANTVEPTPQPTKEEIFGESLNYIDDIPAMVTAFNANTQTQATTLAWVWILLFAVFIMALITLINSYLKGKAFESKTDDLNDAIENANEMTQKMDNLTRAIQTPLNDIKKELSSVRQSVIAILKIPQIKENIPTEEKQNKGFMKIKRLIPKRKKTDSETIKELIEAKPRTEKDEVLEALQTTPEEVKKEKQPSGGFVIKEDEEKTEIELQQQTKQKQHPQIKQTPTKKNLDKEMPEYLVEMLSHIDYKEKHFKEGKLDNWTYNQLNTAFSWISDYRKWALTNNIDIPEHRKNQQEIAEKVIYYAIFKKMDEKLKNGK